MKKMLTVVMVTLISNSSAFEDLQSTAPMHEQLQAQPTNLLDASLPIAQEYLEEEEDTLQNIDEYDQNISDNIIPTKIGNAEALFKEALGALLVRYMSLKEIARTYFEEVKNRLTKWYHNLTNAQ